jgi:hypothetical protein
MNQACVLLKSAITAAGPKKKTPRQLAHRSSVCLLKSAITSN